MGYLENFHHQFYGPENGRKWVFIHGLMGAGQNWRKITSLLEKTERCFVFDQRGHGRSFKPLNGYSPDDYVMDIHMITQEIGWDKFILVGHSMGGRNAFHFAHQFPQKVEGLIIEDIGPEHLPGAEVYYENLLGLVPQVFPNRTEAKKFFTEEFVHKAKTREPVEVIAQFFYSNIIDLPSGEAAFRFQKENIIETVKAGRTKDLWNEIKELQMQTLWLRGRQSVELTQDNFEKILSLNPKIKGQVIENAGHWIHADQPQAFYQAITDFAKNLVE